MVTLNCLFWQKKGVAFRCFELFENVHRLFLRVYYNLIIRFLVISDHQFWYEQARSALRRRLQQNPPSSNSKTYARNVILFVGDGMGIATVTAARILRGQRLGHSGEDQELAWDKFPAVGLAKVNNETQTYPCVWQKIEMYERFVNKKQKRPFYYWEKFFYFIFFFF